MAAQEQTTVKRVIQLPRQESMVLPDVKNPFFHRIKLTAIDIIQIAIMSVTIAPLRLLLVILVVLFLWPLAAIGNACRSHDDRQKPLAGWQWYYMRVIQFGVKVVFFLLGFHRIKVKGEMAKVEEAPIICGAPHSSFLDLYICLMGSQLGSGVSREQNAKIPLLGQFVQFSQPVLVRREDVNSRQTTINEIKRRIQQQGQWPHIFIFPEGTCTNRSCLISFKGGAFFPGAPVQPVCLKYPNKLDTITWTWDGPGGWQCLWLTLCQFHNYMEVEFLPVYHPSAEEINDPKLFASNVRRTMANCLGVPVTDHTYDDCRLMMQAETLKMPKDAGLVEFQKLHQKLGIDFNQMKELLDKFNSIDASGSGHVTLAQFASYLHLPVSPALEEVFALYDRDDSGTIDFREYVIGLSLVSEPVNSEDTVRHAFQLFDKEGKGYISREELQIILRNAFTMNGDESSQLFDQVDVDRDGKISFEDFQAYAEEKPEYARLFVAYHSMADSAQQDSGNGSKGSSSTVTRRHSANTAPTADGKLKKQ